MIWGYLWQPKTLDTIELRFARDFSLFLAFRPSIRSYYYSKMVFSMVPKRLVESFFSHLFLQ